MEITSYALPTCTVVQPSGKLDRRTAAALEQALQAVASSGVHQVVLDLEGVGEMSSAGLRVIISVTKQLRSERKGGDLRLAAPSDRVVQILELAGLLPVLNVYTSREEAIASFDDPVTPAKKRS